MGAFKRALIEAEEAGEPAMWGAMVIGESEALIPEALHDSDKPWLKGIKDAHELEAVQGV